jgi:hypothetical protein
MTKKSVSIRPFRLIRSPIVSQQSEIRNTHSERRPFGWIPESFYERLFTRFGHRSYRWSTVRLKQHSKTTDIGTLEAVPMSATMMMQMKREDFVSKMNLYLDKLVEKGIKVAGLGALTAPLTTGGLALAQRTDICLTNGNAFTAVMMSQAVEKIIQEWRNGTLNRPNLNKLRAFSRKNCLKKVLSA